MARYRQSCVKCVRALRDSCCRPATSIETVGQMAPWALEPGQFLQSAVVRLRVARPEQVWELEGQAFRGGFDAPLLPSLCLRLAASLRSQL